jgi:hypothetical protein
MSPSFGRTVHLRLRQNRLSAYAREDPAPHTTRPVPGIYYRLG